MITFLFIVLPIILEIIYVIKGILNHNLQIPQLIFFLIYIISICYVNSVSNSIFKKKRKVLLIFIIFPILSFFILYIPSSLNSKKHLSIYKKIAEKKSTSQIYIYNESANETIYSINTKLLTDQNSILGKIYNKFGLIETDKEYPVKIQQNEVYHFDIRPGDYKIYLITQNADTKKQYYIDFNQFPISIKSRKESYFVFGGKNFFAFNPSEEEKKQLKAGSFTQDVLLSDSEPTSYKREIATKSIYE